MKKLFLERGLDDKLVALNLVPRLFIRDRLLLAGALGAAMFILAYSMKDSVYYALIPLGAFLGYKYPYYNLKNQELVAADARKDQFAQFLRAFITLLGTQGNIYQTLRECVPQVEEPLRSKLTDLIVKVEDGNDYIHYWGFGEYVGSVEAQLVMSMIHGFAESGIQKEELDELERLIEEIQTNKMNDTVRKKAEKQEQFTNYPLLLTVGFVLFFAGAVIVQNVANLKTYMNMGG